MEQSRTPSGIIVQTRSVSRTFEDAIKERFPVPRIMEWDFGDGRTVHAESHTWAFLENWEMSPRRLLKRDEAIAAGVSLFGQSLYWGAWLLGSHTVKNTKSDFRYTGLNALCDLFAKTFEKHLSSPAARSLDGYGSERCANIVGDQRVSQFDHWMRGYALALQAFMTDPTGLLHPTLKGTIVKYVHDLEFLTKSCAVRAAKPRKLLPMLQNFAHHWDVAPVPLRYFTDQAALDYCNDQLGYDGYNLSTYRRIFRNGGNERDGIGLAGLKPEKPSIIKAWAEKSLSSGADPIRIIRENAKGHGFNPDRAAEELGAFADRIILFEN